MATLAAKHVEEPSQTASTVLGSQVRHNHAADEALQGRGLAAQLGVRPTREGAEPRKVAPRSLPWYAEFVMALAQSKLTAQGQISVPAEVRRRLGVGPGSILEWDEEGSKIVVRRVGGYTSEDLHRALFKKPPRPRSLAELKEGVRRYMRRRHARR